MADSAELIKQAAWILGAGGGGAAIASIVKGLVNGSSSQEKDLREGLSERVGKLEEKVELLEKRLDEANRQRDAWRWLCLQARLMFESLSARHNEQVNPWPADPPSGGTP